MNMMTFFFNDFLNLPMTVSVKKFGGKNLSIFMRKNEVQNVGNINVNKNRRKKKSLAFIYTLFNFVAFQPFTVNSKYTESETTSLPHYQFVGKQPVGS